MIICIILLGVNFVLQEPLLLIVFLLGCLFHQNFKYGLQHSCVYYKGIVSFGRSFGKIILLALVFG